jgi:UDP-N-acetylmuramoyl-tripeptide--D-alanyl-D-alanine ligase
VAVTLIDDSYNSNPAALSEALAAAQELPAARRWAVLGDMLELGEDGPRFHAVAGREAAQRGFDPVVGVGPLARHLTTAASAAGVAVRWFGTATAAAPWAAEELAGGDLVLVKGSRGIGLEAVTAALAAAADRLGEEAL